VISKHHQYKLFGNLKLNKKPQYFGLKALELGKGHIQIWGTTTRTMTHIYIVSFFLRQNACFEMLNNERWICMFSLSTNKCKKIW